MEQIRRFAAITHSSGAAAQFPAMVHIYGQLVRQANMLAYKNAFAILAGVVAVLSPLVWIMRLPPKNRTLDPEQMAAH